MPCLSKSYTVLGVDIESTTGVPLADYNALSPSFGLPVTLNTNLSYAAASNLVDTVASLPGTSKVMLAHSLGNMLVSSAAVDHGLAYDRYYMLNAAVPMEAYDADSSDASMEDSAWSLVPENYRASGWSGLFDNTNDFRRLLSWQGRFAGIHDAVNCYSLSEDVLENATEHGYGSSWAKQELFKGTAVWHGLNTVLFFNDDVSCEGGWGVNTYYAANPTYYVPLAGFHGSVSNLAREAAIEHPLFTPFRAEAEAMHSTNLFVVSDAAYRDELRAKLGLREGLRRPRFILEGSDRWKRTIGGVSFLYYLNPTPNDRNLEWDMNTNPLSHAWRSWRAQAIKCG